MKVEINQEVFLKALEKGGAAALSDEAKTDTSNYSTLIKSVKITAGKKFVIESLTNLVAIRHSLDVGKDHGITIEEEGTAVVQAKDLVDWVKIQGNTSIIKMVLSKLASPELLDSGSEDDDMKSSIKKVGDLKIASKDEAKTIGKWELDSYDETQYPAIDFSKKGDKMFDTYSQYFTEGVEKASVGAMDKDYDHIYDSISIQVADNDVYFATTDTKRCALYKLPVVEDLQSKQTVMIPVALLEGLKKVVGKEVKMTFSFEDESNKIFVDMPDTNVRLLCAEKEAIKKFPSISMLLDKDYKDLIEISKVSLNKILVTAAIVNSSSALFDFDKDKGTLIVKAISDEGKHKPTQTKTKLESVGLSSKSVWGVKHLQDCLKAVDSDRVELKVPDNQSLLHVVDGENFQYFTMKINNPKYTKA